MRNVKLHKKILRIMEHEANNNSKPRPGQYAILLK